MKKLLTIALFLLSFTAIASVSIISDLDDTIKITASDGRPSDVLDDDVFTGMPEFFAHAAQNYSNELYILSASPTLMSPVIKSTLSKRGIVYKRLILRKNILEDKFQYKVREIKKILEESADDFILIGDDLGKDPEVFAEIKRHYPSRILGTYIHKVNGRAFQDNTPYYTSFDLFLREFEAGRMEVASVEKAFEILNAETRLGLIFPRKAECPTLPIVWAWQLRTLFMKEAVTLAKKFNEYCKATQSVNLLVQ